MIFPDWTLFVELVFFVFLIWALNRLVFKPLLELIQRRKEAIIEKTASADTSSAEADKRLAEYRSRIEKALSEAEEVRSSILRNAKEEQRKILMSAQSRYERMLAEQVESAKAQAEVVKSELELKVEELAKTLVERLLS